MSDNGIVDIETGKIFGGTLDLTAPNVFVKGDDEIVLLAEMDHEDLLESYSLDDLQGPLGSPFSQSFGTFELDVPSGAVVVNIAYNATPEEGTDTSGLSKNCWHEGLPFLPKSAPSKPHYHTADDENYDWRAHCIVPVKPGKYTLEAGECEGGDSGFMKLVLRRQS